MTESKSGNFRVEIVEVDEELILEVLEEQSEDGYENTNAFVDKKDLFLIFKRIRAIHVKTCENCRKTFKSIRSDTKTCSDVCRVTLHRKNKKGAKK